MYVDQRSEGFIADREAIATWLGRSVNTIRKRCVVVERTARGVPLYNMEHCAHVLQDVHERPTARRRPGVDTPPESASIRR